MTLLMKINKLFETNKIIGTLFGLCLSMEKTLSGRYLNNHLNIAKARIVPK